MSLPKLIYWFSSGLLALLLLFSATMHFLNHAQVVHTFEELGYPTYLIYPLAILKILAVLAIITSKSRFLKKLAYSGVFYILILAFVAHLLERDGAGFFAFLGLCLLVVSYTFDKILRPKNTDGFEI